MKDYIYLGESPSEERCAQVGSPNYFEEAPKECRRLIELIRKKMGEEPTGARLKIHRTEHYEGPRWEVICEYDSHYREAVEYAFACEAHYPLTWDDTSKIDWQFESAYEDNWEARDDV